MNAKRVAIIAIRTQHVQILLGHSIALVKLASLEMGLTVKVKFSLKLEIGVGKQRLNFSST